MHQRLSIVLGKSSSSPCVTQDKSEQQFWGQWCHLQRHRPWLHSCTLQINTLFAPTSSVNMSALWELLSCWLLNNNLGFCLEKHQKCFLFKKNSKRTVQKCSWGHQINIFIIFLNQLDCNVLNASFKRILYSWASYWIYFELEVLKIWFYTYFKKWDNNRHHEFLLNFKQHLWSSSLWFKHEVWDQGLQKLNPRILSSIYFKGLFCNAIRKGHFH